MTPMQKLLVEQSELREAVNTILGIAEAERTDEQRAKLTSATERLKAMEPDLRAAITAHDADQNKLRGEFGTREGAELRALIAGASAGEIYTAAIEHRQTDGRTAELQQHFKLGANQIPLALLREPVEERAVTPAPADVQTNQSEIIPAVFPQSAAMFLGIDMPTVGVGEAVFPVLTDSAVAGVPAENALPTGTGIDTEGASTGAFTADVLSPGRIQAAFFYSREDRARFAGMDSALRQNLTDALSDKLDQQILAGSNGLLAGTILANHNVNAATSYALYRSQLAYGRVDGTYAGSVSDIRILVGAATYGDMAGKFRATTAGDRAAVEDLMNATAGVRVSAHVPAVANSKQNTLIRLGMRRDMVAPLWEGVTLIPDEVTKAGTGQILVTAVMLHAIKLLRAGGFYKQQVQHG